jgi:hypothetical protein
MSGSTAATSPIGSTSKTHVEASCNEFNHIRPHEALDWARLIGAYVPLTQPARKG